MCRFENKSTSRRCAFLWSFLSFLSGAAVIYFSIMLMWADVLEKVEKHIDYMEKYEVRTYLFVALFGLAVFIVLFSCFGMLFRWMRNRCCTVLYGCCLLPLWVGTMGVGFGAIFVSYTSADEFSKACEFLESEWSSDEELPNYYLGDSVDVNLNIFKDI